MTERIRVRAENLIAYPRPTCMTYHKHEKDRFKLLAKLFDMLDKKRATASGKEEVLTLMDLLSVDVEEQKK